LGGIEFYRVITKQSLWVSVTAFGGEEASNLFGKLAAAAAAAVTRLKIMAYP
jgi:hypothetical protein